MLHYATAGRLPPFAGLVLASPPGRAVGEVVLAQLADQLRSVPAGGTLFAKVEEAAALRPTISFAYPANANHVLKEDLRSIEVIRPAPGTGYNEPGTRLDPETVATIISWLHGVVG